MTSDEVKSLRTELGCSARELATAIGVEQAEVLAWERGERFPTKRFVDAMQKLRAKGPSAIPSKRRGGAVSPHRALADPEVWRLVRKLLVHPELLRAALRLAEPYADPANEGD